MNAKVGSSELKKQVSLQNTGVILSVAATIPDQTLPGGDLRIPVDKLGAALGYTIPKPVYEYERDRLTVFLRVKGDPTKIPLMTGHSLGPVADRKWPMPFTIPLSELKELATPETPTEYELVYVLIASGSNPGPEAVAEYKIDKTKPYQTKTPATDFSPPAAAFPVDLPPNKDIDDAYLGANPAGIEITIALAPNNAEATDVCDVYWGIPADPEYATPVLTGVVVPADGKIVIPTSIFLNSKEGMNTLTYVVKDLAGNISRRSKPDQRNVRRLAPPVALPPVVPLADGTGGDNLIDIADCKQGVTIEVPVPLPNAPTDSIIAYWQDIALPEQRIGSNTLLVFPVDYATIIKVAYGATDGAVPTTISYEMFRGPGAPIAEEEADIEVDISYPGPTNPNEPDPVNTDLELPRLVSSQGVDNKLDDNDFGEPADIFIQLYDAPATESAQSITVFYDDQELDPPYLLRPGEEGTEILAATVPWLTIEKKLNATVKLKWKLSSVLGANPVFSEEQDVVVDVTKIDLPKPQVKGLIFDSISCPTLNFLPVSDPEYPGDGTPRRNLKVTIPYSSSLVDGRTVTLKWGGFENESATDPITGTEITKDILISGTVPAEGIETDIGDYMLHFKPVSDGFGKLTYTVTDVVPESDAATHFVFLVDNDGDYCEIANPIPTP
jgi:hypothetical protein